MKYKYVILPVVVMLISGCATQFSNLLIKDSLLDDGSSISNDRIFWFSPDIWLDNDGDGNPDEMPKIGETNRLFARVHNIGTLEAKDIKVKFYANEANTYFSYDDNSFVGTNFIPAIEPGKSVITSISWENVKEAIFWAFGVAVETKEDPITSMEPGKDSKLAYRSFWDVYTYPGRPVILKFRIQNPFPTKAEVNLTLDTQSIPANWNAYLGKTSFNLLAKESKPVLLMVTPAINPKNKEGIINVIARIEGKIVGGVSYRIKVKE